MRAKTAIAVIGPGKVGTALAIAASRTGHHEIIIGARTETKGRKAAEQLGDHVAVLSPHQAASAGDIVLLTVADDAIKAVCDELAAARSFKAGSVVAHCSGVLTSDELLAAKQQCGASIASMHPLQTFPAVAAALKNIPGSYCYCEGDAGALDCIKSFTSDIGLHPVEIRKEAKSLYHASAVVACNYLSALMDAALELGEHAGIDRNILWKSLHPLVSATLDNIGSMGAEAALTGPIVRGDLATIDKHLGSLEALGSAGARLSGLYSSMGLQTVLLAASKGRISSEIESLLIARLDNIQ